VEGLQTNGALLGALRPPLEQLDDGLGGQQVFGKVQQVRDEFRIGFHGR
jgi:hypothetical protein